MEDTWVPRGTETAKLLYNAPGWVVHDELNIFGSTGMKEVAQWANYPAAAAWMMQHVYDHFSYSQNLTWFKEQGYPLMKGVAEFWLSQLQEDEFFKDGTSVVNPCNSPEHGSTTFGCTNYQHSFISSSSTSNPPSPLSQTWKRIKTPSPTSRNQPKSWTRAFTSAPGARSKNGRSPTLSATTSKETRTGTSPTS